MPKQQTIDNQYLNEYINDLKKWQKEIKNKDKEIKQSKLNNEPIINIQPKSTSTAVPTSTTNTIIDNTNESIKYKEKGNLLFGQQKYKESIEYYTLAIQFDSTNAILYANRAMSYLKMKNYNQSEIDSTRCLNLDSTYTKAYHRRGLARIELQKYSDAITDFKHVLKVDPSNKESSIELNKASSLLNIQIETQNKQLEQERKQQEQKEIEEKEKLEKQKPKIIEAISTPTTAPTKPTPAAVPVSTSPTPAATKPLTLQERLSRMTNLRAPIPKVAPKNSFDFEKIYCSFNGNHLEFYEYFKLIDPNQLPKILGDAITPSIFTDIISILEKHYLINKEYSLIFKILNNLLKIGRMSLNIQFSSKSEKDTLKSIINSLYDNCIGGDGGNIEKSQIDNLLNKYCM